MSKIYDLFTLIKSFNKSEKRYFKFQSMQHRPKQAANYVQLFDLLEKQDKLDEKAILAQLKDKDFAKSLPAGKNYLYNFLLKCLRNYHSSKLAKFEVRELYISAMILSERNLAGQTNKLLEKAKKITKKYDLFHERLTILNWQRYLIRISPPKDAVEKLTLLQDEYDLCIQNLQRVATLQKHYETIFLASKLRNQSKEDLDKTFKQFETDLSNMEQLDSSSFPELTIKTFTQTLYHRKNKNFDLSDQYFQYFLNHFNEHPHLKKEYQVRYIAILTNRIGNLLRGKMYEDIPFILNQLETVTPNNSQLKIVLDDLTIYSKVVYYLITEDFESVYKLAPEALNFLKKHNHQLTLVRRLTIAQNFATGVFMAGHFNSSLDWIEFILQTSETENKVRPDIRMHALRLQILNHFELDNDILVVHLIRSATRKYNNSKYKMYTIPIFKVIKKILRRPHDKKELLIKHFNELSDSLKQDDVGIWIRNKYLSGK